MELIRKTVSYVPLEMTGSLSICFSQSCVKHSSPEGQLVVGFPSEQAGDDALWSGLVSALPALPRWLCLEG